MSYYSLLRGGGGERGLSLLEEREATDAEVWRQGTSQVSSGSGCLRGQGKRWGGKPARCWAGPQQCCLNILSAEISDTVS